MNEPRYGKAGLILFYLHSVFAVQLGDPLLEDIFVFLVIEVLSLENEIQYLLTLLGVVLIQNDFIIVAFFFCGYFLFRAKLKLVCMICLLLQMAGTVGSSSLPFLRFLSIVARRNVMIFLACLTASLSNFADVEGGTAGQLAGKTIETTALIALVLPLA